ncbi:TraV family lipoprotein [Verrucomicrobium sp. 3C]|uniref:TraV family lipoprotein n=1 Tax=Verrucomicrobium sp. 3C TaxID=1134055 RepID=UPI0018CBD2C0|nr:TraV family lipoprotein [Verrucomicrobium sp. 3C]
MKRTVFLLPLLMASCAAHPKEHPQPVAVHRKIVEPTYSFAHPPEIGGVEPQDPKLIPPKYVKVWVKGRVDEQGNAHSGEYVWVMTRPGHWESEEESGLEPKPLFVRGQQVVPNPGSASKGLEVDYDRMNKRLDKVEGSVRGMELSDEQRKMLAEFGSSDRAGELPKGGLAESKSRIRAGELPRGRPGQRISAADPEDDHPLPKKTSSTSLRIPVQPAGSFERVKLPDGDVALVIFGADDVSVSVRGKTFRKPIDASANTVVLKVSDD